MSPKKPPAISRQIKLPLSKAVEIAWKSIRQRLSRSMLVTSAIVLALAFLCSILTTESILDGMRDWTTSWPKSAEFAKLKQERETLDIDLKASESILRADAATAKPPADAKAFDPKIGLGKDEDWDMLRQRIGALPVPTGELQKILTARPEKIDEVKKLIALTEQRRVLRTKLSGPEDLTAAMNARGVPTTPADIAGNRIQTRWVIGLALLVAFVGILNAMLMSVTERFREIGTMKCLGALDGFIVKLFLLESLFQGTVGTTLGILVGLGVSFGIAALSYGGAVWLNVPWSQVGVNVLITLVVGMALSVGGAILPAAQAARMHPIEAMRVEA